MSLAIIIQVSYRKICLMIIIAAARAAFASSFTPSATIAMADVVSGPDRAAASAAAASWAAAACRVGAG